MLITEPAQIRQSIGAAVATASDMLKARRYSSSAGFSNNFKLNVPQIRVIPIPSGMLADQFETDQLATRLPGVRHGRG
jgi:hypothetical protein